MQRKFGMLLVLVLALSLVFCVAATAWADDETPTEDTGALTNPAEETPLTEDELAAEEAATEKEATEETATEEATEEIVGFTDVPADYWAYDYIMDISGRKLTTGTGEGVFSPENSLTRAQFVTFLGRLAGVDATAYEEQNSAFTDISGAAISYAYGFINWAAEIGVTTGATADTFNPNGQLTREQMATMVLRFANYYGIVLENEADPVFTDAGQVNDYAKDAVNILADSYINLLDGEFVPQGLATRAQMAQVLSLFPVPEAGFVPADPVGYPDPDEEEVAEEEAAEEEAAEEEAAEEEAAEEEAAEEEAAEEEAAE